MIFPVKQRGMFNPSPDCLRCGACCYSPSDRFVRVTGADWTRLGEAAERVAHFIGRGNEAYMRMAGGHCAALEVRATGTGADAAPEYFCTIYARRPQICRDLARGSPECEGERALDRRGGQPLPLDPGAVPSLPSRSRRQSVA